jgi:hypothetical protein
MEALVSKSGENRMMVFDRRTAARAIMGLGAASFLPSRVFAAYARPYGPTAPWNIPVADLAVHSQSTIYRDRLWNNGSTAPGNINLTFDGYTYPVYDAQQATGQYRVSTSSWANLNGKTMPWNGSWKAATGSDGQIIVLDPPTGREWNLWQVRFSGGVVTATNGNLVPGSYWTKVDGFRPSRGCGIQYLAMLVRPGEVADGAIRHALSMPAKGVDRLLYLPPATKTDGDRRGISNGVPEGMRFALRVTDAEIEAWISKLPAALGSATRQSARIIARALRDYGWFITDYAGSAHFQFEDRLTAGAQWTSLGLGKISAGWKEYPRDLLDGLLQRERIYALAPGS